MAFAIDFDDCEIIVWRSLVGGGISGDRVHDMILEVRGLRAPHPVEWLSDIGGSYAAQPICAFAQATNLTRCFTPVASPESNGLSEALLKTSKRDYVRVHPLSHTKTVLLLIAGWIEAYESCIACRVSGSSNDIRHSA